MNSAHLLSGLCTISSFPIRRAWHKFASQPRAGISNMSLSPLSTNLALVVSASCSHLCQGTWGGLILNTRMNFPHTEHQWNCHIERRKAKQIGWCGFLWTRLVYIWAVIIVNHFHAVLTAIRDVPTRVSRPFYFPSWISAEESGQHTEERIN